MLLSHVSAVWLLFLSATGLVLNPDPESESEDSEPDGPDDPIIPSPEMDDVKGESCSFQPSVEPNDCPLLARQTKHNKQPLLQSQFSACLMRH